ncbi:threonylcarbamoyl-AMP synthase [Ahniella affigens]|uniref:L-threonylcarbamoyladenylate synthase n=1 Tax=Ahniella affigens TaxID=2021234 RepID=A0A2P1PTT4_9GAMM|nr:L-threonylcarbamoyladenylate synthase [Ahniella affigens]AVP98241.1 threonylcarbamoyl-AMP synthase [Ahniella affigens]
MLPIRLEAITEAVAALRRGEVIGLPTETVYGLAGDARNPEALQRIFATKGRPADHPLIVHLADAKQLSDWAIDVPVAALQLAQAFWPGPMTLILKRQANVSDLVTGGQDTVGLRVPSHPWAQAVLQAFGGGLAAPSANRFGHVSPTTAQHVRDEFGEAVPVVLDAGPCQVGIESTIIDLSTGFARILRPGLITAEQIEAVLHASPEAPGARQTSADTPRVSGSLASHYAPGRLRSWSVAVGSTRAIESWNAMTKRCACSVSGHCHRVWTDWRCRIHPSNTRDICMPRSACWIRKARTGF